MKEENIYQVKMLGLYLSFYILFSFVAVMALVPFLVRPRVVSTNKELIVKFILYLCLIFFLGLISTQIVLPYVLGDLFHGVNLHDEIIYNLISVTFIAPVLGYVLYKAREYGAIKSGDK